MEHGTITTSGPGTYLNTDDPERTLIQTRKRVCSKERETEMIRSAFSEMSESLNDYINICDDIIKDISDCFSIIINGSEVNNLYEKFSTLRKFAGTIKSCLEQLKGNLNNYISQCSNDDLADLHRQLMTTVTTYLNDSRVYWIRVARSITNPTGPTAGKVRHVDEDERKSAIKMIENGIINTFFSDIGEYEKHIHERE